jgi:23S rRNA pseudouridine1911/1915/1917 synthase
MGNSHHVWNVDESSAGERLDKFLAAADRIGSRGRASDALARGRVFINDEEVALREAGRRLSVGDRVRFWPDRPGSAQRRRPRLPRAGEISIIYEDDVLAVVNKPAGLLAVPLERRENAASVQDELLLHWRSHGKRRPFVVHRIDRDTSGLVLFARRRDAQTALKDQFRRHEPDRVYLAVVYGHPSPPAGTWRDRLVWDQKVLIQKETHAGDPRGRAAHCEYRTLEHLRGAALIEVRLVTGRRNQIRLQARLRGHALVGEARYIYGPDTLRPIEFPRQALHAHRLGFRHPTTGKTMHFEAPLPADMVELIRRLRNPG